MCTHIYAHSRKHQVKCVSLPHDSANRVLARKPFWLQGRCWDPVCLLSFSFAVRSRSDSTWPEWEMKYSVRLTAAYIEAIPYKHPPSLIYAQGWYPLYCNHFGVKPRYFIGRLYIYDIYIYMYIYTYIYIYIAISHW